MSFKEQIEREREQKDEYFKKHPRSPIPREEKDEFDGLNYYEVNPDLRFKLELTEHEDKEKIKVEDSKGNKQEFIKWGEFNFKIDGEQVTLQAFKGDKSEGRLWVPFKDETNGKETYGAGRYIDLEPQEHKENGKWILDLNQAYSPSCAYNEGFVCPFIPPENWLDVEIEAGEKNYENC